MAFAFQITLVEYPGIAAFRIAQDFPCIAVPIPEMETVGAMLLDRFAAGAYGS